MNTQNANLLNQLNNVNVQNEINEYSLFFKSYPEYQSLKYNEFTLVLCDELQ